MNTIRDDLNSGKLRQFYVLTGTEEYLCRLYQQRLTKALFPEEDAMNCMMFDGSIVTTNTPNRFFSRNSFYTTAANRMSRHIFDNAVNTEDVIELCRENSHGRKK